MALTALSPEMKIKNALRELNCAESNFAKLVVGIVGKTRIAEALNENPNVQRDFDRGDAEQLLEVIGEMRELAAAIDAVPIAWEHTDKVKTALVLRRIKKIAAELGDAELVGVAWNAAREAQKSL